ncbi:PepSY domain-containing protein [Ekhidna sp.]|uniref:PepSY domain-containing protein n=1 Tax=Ekhidna sp. TaxID=2608089 RepID=UPI00329731F9
MKRNTNYYIRKAHRYLGLFLGIQFLFWTLGGLYFSWSDIDKIHGEHLVMEKKDFSTTSGLIAPDSILIKINSRQPLTPIAKIELVETLGEPYYQLQLMTGEYRLFSAKTGHLKPQFTKDEVIEIARTYITFEAEVKETELLTIVSNHHEYRERHLPVWAIAFDYEGDPVVYVDAVTGQFERIRHNSWRVFDWLWMMHTMDYETRDNFGNWLLKAFSILGLITVLSGFLLFGVSYNKREFKFLKIKKS